MSNQEEKLPHESSFEEIMHYAFAPILMHYCEYYHTILPSVVWLKAREIKMLMSKELADPDDIVHIAVNETKKMRRNDKFVVLLTLMHLLYEPLPGQDDVGMMDIMIGISKEVQYHPLRGKLMQEINTLPHRDTLTGGTELQNIQDAQLELIKKLVDCCIRAKDFGTLKNLRMLIFELNLDEDHRYDPLLKEIRKYVPGGWHDEDEKKDEKKDLKKDEKKDNETTTVQEVKKPFKLKLTDKETKKVLDRLMEVKADDGKYMFRKPCQWIAVYRIFVEVLEWTTEYRSFSKRSNHLGELRIPCSESSVKRIDGVFNLPFEDWDEAKYKGKGKVYERQYCIGAWLMRELRTIKDKKESQK